MAERILKAQETGTSGKHEASFIHWDSRFSACYIFLFTVGAGLALFAIYWQWHFKFKHSQMVLNGFSPEKNFFAFSFPE